MAPAKKKTSSPRRNQYARGVRAEYRSRDLLEALGYDVTRAAGSHGPWDLVAVSNSDLILCQVKLNKPPSKLEREKMQLAKAPYNARKLVHVWKPRASKPLVYEV